jgi:hypothetical protein
MSVCYPSNRPCRPIRSWASRLPHFLDSRLTVDGCSIVPQPTTSPRTPMTMSVEFETFQYKIVWRSIQRFSNSYMHRDRRDRRTDVAKLQFPKRCVFLFIEFRTMDKVQKPSSNELIFMFLYVQWEVKTFGIKSWMRKDLEGSGHVLFQISLNFCWEERGKSRKHLVLRPRF